MLNRRRILVAAAILAAATALFYSRPKPSQAGAGTFQPFLSGFAGPNNKGLPLPGTVIYGSSPTLADLNHDGKLEMIVGSGQRPDGSYVGDGYLTVIKSDGTILWSVQGRLPSELTGNKIQPPINSTPSVIKDIDGDGWDDIVVGLGGGAYGASNWDGGVAAFSGRTGQRLWVFNSDDWNNHIVDGYADGVYSTPAVGDVYGDGNQEIAFGSWDQCIYLLDHNGNPLWTNPILPAQGHCKGNHGYYNEDTIWSSPAMADLDGDGKLEIIIGADVSSGNVFGDPPGGYLYVFRYDGQVLARQWVDQAVWSSPAVADLNGDGKSEIVVGSGLPLLNAGHYVKAWSYTPNSDPTKALTLKWTGTTSGKVFTSPAIGDLNKDGTLDVVAISYLGDTQCGMRVYAWSGTNGQLLPGFPADPQTLFGTNTGCALSSPVLADIGNDGYLKILFGNAGEVTILNHDGTQYTDNTTGGSKPTFYGYSSFTSSPAVGDINNDGVLEVIAAGALDAGDATNQNIGSLKVWEPALAASASNARPWPMFHQNASHTGLYFPPHLAVSPGSLLVLHQTGQSNLEKINLLVQNTGGDSLSWTSSVPAGVTLSPNSGTMMTTQLITVTVTTAGQTAGTHYLGNIVITASGVTGSPATIPVTLRVANLSRVFLPSIFKH